MLTMFRSGLRHNPKEAESHLLRDLLGNVVVKKHNLQSLLVGEFSAETCHRGDQAS